MRGIARYCLVGLVAAGVLAAGPALAAPSLYPPHTSVYDQWSTIGTRPLDDVAINVDRHTKRASVTVNNRCFGTYEFTLGVPFRQSNYVDVRVPVRDARLSFAGVATVARGINAEPGKRVRMRLSAKVTPSAISGHVSFPHGSCPKIHFVAPLRARTN